MRGLAVAAAALLALAGCLRDETVAGYGAADRDWRLAEMDGTDFAGTATLRFPTRGRIAGLAPCGPWQGRMVTPYPWFELDAVQTASPGCGTDIVLAALAEMSLSEVSGPVLILSNGAGRMMVFRSDG
ncbi:META domain-containing protein [Pukyongiella litopenaei]|uniref:META domain-containing protein n=1 Tax=Pukyongiella litopenaei TaxID=2605946 RepID=A0A2S0MR91_9RHOB|nr:META domain-containing protein [Pukyongiella litopenaei]AVO38408.1 META domain-containing protein [Pukyongiella litopenaei]